MKYLALLLLLISCTSEPKFKAGDCVRVISSVGVIDYLIIDVTEKMYVGKVIFKKDGLVYTLKQKDVYYISFIDEETETKKINCSDAE